MGRGTSGVVDNPKLLWHTDQQLQAVPLRMQPGGRSRRAGETNKSNAASVLTPAAAEFMPVSDSPREGIAGPDEREEGLAERERRRPLRRRWTASTTCHRQLANPLHLVDRDFPT